MKKKILISMMSWVANPTGKTLINCEEILKVFKLSYEKDCFCPLELLNVFMNMQKILKTEELKLLLPDRWCSCISPPGMIASLTTTPVLGVPIESKVNERDRQSLSIVQMPAGIPLPTLAIGNAGAINASLAAISILGNKYPQILKKLKYTDQK